MSATYTAGFREAMVRRMTGPTAQSATALAKETGIAQPTLSRWLLVASTLPAMSKQHDGGPPKSTRQWTAAEKLAVVTEAAALAPADLGAFLRAKGLRSSELHAWREQIVVALGDTKASRRKAKAEAGRIKNLERELERKDRRLRAVETLLELQKKVREIWAEEGEFTPPRNAP